jgi:hypothetical protein
MDRSCDSIFALGHVRFACFDCIVGWHGVSSSSHKGTIREIRLFWGRHKEAFEPVHALNGMTVDTENFGEPVRCSSFFEVQVQLQSQNQSGFRVLSVVPR